MLALRPLPGNKSVRIVCRVVSLPGLMTEGAGLLATKSRASVGVLAARPSAAAIRWRFMWGSGVIATRRFPVAAGAQCIDAVVFAVPREHGISPMNGRCIDTR